MSLLREYWGPALCAVIFAVEGVRLFLWHRERRAAERDFDRRMAEMRGYNGLPVCECTKPKDVVPGGQPRFTGWCGRCGKDLAAKQRR